MTATGILIAPAVAQARLRGEEPGELVARHLQQQVANVFMLYANYKHYHWQAYGPLFRDLHLLFDELANAVLSTVDEFAERLRMGGRDPVSDYRVLLDISRITPSRPGRTMKQMATEARDNLLPLIADMREAVRLANNDDDPGTVDLLSRTVRLHEKHEWFLRQISAQKDELTN
jgi:starvation-inducible DNA-binding protein